MFPCHFRSLTPPSLSLQTLPGCYHLHWCLKTYFCNNCLLVLRKKKKNHQCGYKPVQLLAWASSPLASTAGPEEHTQVPEESQPAPFPSSRMGGMTSSPDSLLTVPSPDEIQIICRQTKREEPSFCTAFCCLCCILTTSREYKAIAAPTILSLCNYSDSCSWPWFLTLFCAWETSLQVPNALT